MYDHNNNSNYPDRFAGQYPPPPPLTSPVVEATPQNNTSSFSTPIQHYQENSYINQYTPTPPPAVTQIPQLQHYNTPPPAVPQQSYYQEPVAPQHYQQYQPEHQEVYIPPPPVASSYNNNNNYYYTNHTVPPTIPAVVDEQQQQQQQQQQPLEDYLRQEREEYMRHDGGSNEYSNIHVEQQNEPEKIPMVQKEQEARPSRKERKRIEKLKQEAATTYTPYVTKPILAPQEDEAESYRPKPYEKREKRGCSNCCCYNPAITCCSFFCLLISIAFCAAGVAMIIASKVVSDKCTNQCSSVVEQAQSACSTICSTVLKDGLLYGGIVVAGLAGISIIWKLIMWTCAGYSQRR